MARSSPQQTVLVIRHHGLGDLVTSQPALHALRRHFPYHHLAVTCPSWLTGLARFFGTADQLISEVPADGAVARHPVDPSDHQQADRGVIANVLREVSDVDVLVSLRTPGPELCDVNAALSPRLLVSYRFAPLPLTMSYPELDFSDHILMRWRRLLGTIGIHTRDTDLYRELAPPAHLSGYTVVHVGAGSPSRLWPAARWIAVVRHLQSSGHKVVLTGSPGERRRVQQVCDGAGLRAEYVRCDGDIWELAQLVAGARLVLCVDTGLSHLATVFRRPAVTLFGPIPPEWWGPPAGNPQHKTIWTGRTGDNYGTTVDPGLIEISIESVVKAVEELQREIR